MFKRVTITVSAVFFFSGLALLALNLYGLTQELRPQGLAPEVLRFGERDLRLTPSELKAAINKGADESEGDYARRLTYALADGMAHVEWEMYDPDQFHQRVPIWENYILYAMGVLTTIPEFQRYHFSDPYRSVERGIGICGDASMTLSSLLNEHNIDNKIVTVPGHVMVQAQLDGEKVLLDADYGIVLNNSIAHYHTDPMALAKEYQARFNKVNDGELMIANNLRDKGYRLWNGTAHFITNKYYFEKFAYVAKWLFPVILLILGVFLWRKWRTD